MGERMKRYTIPDKGGVGFFAGQRYLAYNYYGNGGCPPEAINKLGEIEDLEEAVGISAVEALKKAKAEKEAKECQSNSTNER